uniref:hypothetical protein n=1 Tax=Streptomyces sp. 1222.5 TaxID=1881026 RepID=UPI003D73F545
MTVRHTLSILSWHEDGSSTWLRWVVDIDEIGRVRDFLGAPDAEGLITPEQADEARAATQLWLSYMREEPS